MHKTIIILTRNLRYEVFKAAWIFGNNFLCGVRNISLCPNPLEKNFVISLITSLSMNVKEIIWGNIKGVVEEIDEENGGKVEVMKLKEEIKPEGWKRRK